MLSCSKAIHRLMLSLCLAAASVAAPAKLPERPATLPAPTGDYGIGSYARTVAFPTRREIFTVDPKDTRRVPVRVYYPIRKGSCAPSRNFPETLAAIYSSELGMSPGFERYLLAHNCPDVPIVEGNQRFPLILFSHGFTHTHYSYVSIIEDLVSHGNIVVAIDHTYGSRATYFPDAPLVRFDPSRWGGGTDQDAYRKAFAEYPRLWAEDSRRILDLLTADAPSPLQQPIRGRADFDRIAYVGHSFGGRTAIYTTQHDARIKGGVNLDGNIRETLITPVASDAPFLVLNAETVDERKTYAPSIRVVPVKGTAHMHFSDIVWMRENFGAEGGPGAGPQGAAAEPGKMLSGTDGIRLTREVLRHFLDCTFAGRCDRLESRLAEVRAPAPAATPAASQ